MKKKLKKFGKMKKMKSKKIKDEFKDYPGPIDKDHEGLYFTSEKILDKRIFEGIL